MGAQAAAFSAAFVLGVAAAVVVVAAAARLGAARIEAKAAKRDMKSYVDTRRRIDESEAEFDDSDVGAVRDWLRRRAKR